MFIVERDDSLLNESGHLQNDFKRLHKVFLKKKLRNKTRPILNTEEIEKKYRKTFSSNESVKHSLGFLNPINGKLFLNFLEDVRHVRSLILLLTLKDGGILRQAGFTDYEITIIKLASEKLHRQKFLKEDVAFQLSE